jgi:hypothetical protein
MLRQRSSPDDPGSCIILAGKLGLALARDLRGKEQPQYLVNDQLLIDHIPKMPLGHWKMYRFEEPEQLMPTQGGL